MGCACVPPQVISIDDSETTSETDTEQEDVLPDSIPTLSTNRGTLSAREFFRTLLLCFKAPSIEAELENAVIVVW